MEEKSDGQKYATRSESKRFPVYTDVLYVMKLTMQLAVLYNAFSYAFQWSMHIDGHDLSDDCNEYFHKFHRAKVFLQ